MLLDWRIDYTSAYGYHEIFVCAGDQDIKFALFIGLIEIISNLAALETVCVVDYVEYIMLLAYLGDVDNFVGGPRSKAAGCTEHTENLIGCQTLYSGLDFFKVSDKLLVVMLRLYDYWLEVCRKNTLETGLLINTRPDDILSLWFKRFEGKQA